MEINSKYLGIICITLAQVFFTTQDMAIKFISGNYALHQIILIRASVAILFTLKWTPSVVSGVYKSKKSFLRGNVFLEVNQLKQLLTG